MQEWTWVELRVEGWREVEGGGENPKRIWETEEGDRVGMFYFGLQPNLPMVASVDELREWFRVGVEEQGAKLVEVDVCEVGGRRAVWVVFKTRMEPSGFIYVGSVTVPFEGRSVVFKVQCQEQGITGVRETVLLDRRLGAGGSLEAEWTSDAKEYDSAFPDHPLSKVRRALNRVLGGVVWKEEASKWGAFRLPER